MPGCLTIIGLGPGDPQLRTLGAQRALDQAERIILRTSIHPGVDDLLVDSRVAGCDDLYDRSASFEIVYEAIVDRVISACSKSTVVYAVPGHPWFGERTVELLIAGAAKAGISVSVLSGVSALDVVSAALGVDPVATQAQVLDAMALVAFVEREPFSGGLLEISPTRPIIVTQVYSRSIASSVKMALSRLFPDEHPIRVASAAGVPGEEVIVDCHLYELDRQAVNHLSSVWAPPLSTLHGVRSAATLHRISSILRSPDGCPWDRKQTHESLRDAVIEEAHEVVDAIDEGDGDHLAEELGDLALQIALHAQIAEEAGIFTIEDVYEHVNRKLIRRHPHVFGEAAAATPDDVVRTWQGVKAEERRLKGEVIPEPDPFDRLPRSMPVLTRVARSLEPSAVATPSESLDLLGDRLLDAVQQLVNAGRNPERELEIAFRRRMAAEST